MGDWSDKLDYEQREYYGHFYDPDREEETEEETEEMTTVEILKEMAFTATETQRRALEDAISALSENKGEWIEESDNYGHSSYFCSRCGTQEGKPSDICPNCRARMSNSENPNKWIPVSERLPDNNVRVLCSAISTSISGGHTRFVGCCNNGFWFVQTDAETVSYPRQYKVTAWMPLPEPYKAEKGGEE